MPGGIESMTCQANRVAPMSLSLESKIKTSSGSISRAGGGGSMNGTTYKPS